VEEEEEEQEEEEQQQPAAQEPQSRPFKPAAALSIAQRYPSAPLPAGEVPPSAPPGTAMLLRLSRSWSRLRLAAASSGRLEIQVGVGLGWPTQEGDA
jgi:hypothetical protein